MAYWVVRSKIINKVNYKKYIDFVSDIVKKYCVKILAHFGTFNVLEGIDEFYRLVNIEFSLFQDGKKCLSSKEYQKAVSFRKNESVLADLILIESVDAT